MLSAVIIRMLFDAGFHELIFYDNDIDEKDAHLPLNSPIRQVVKTLQQWICRDKKNVSSEFHIYFPNTVNTEIFNVKKEKNYPIWQLTDGISGLWE